MNELELILGLGYLLIFLGFALYEINHHWGDEA
jgi:hypothetical protein